MIKNLSHRKKKKMSFLFNVNNTTHHQHSISTDSVDTLMSGTTSDDMSPVDSSGPLFSKFTKKMNQNNNNNQKSNRPDIETITVSFAAAGWLQVYLFGTAHALIQNVPGVRIEGLLDSYQDYLKNNNIHHNHDKSPIETPTLPTPTALSGTQPASSRSPSVSHIDGLTEEYDEGENKNEQEQKPQFPRFKFIGSSAGSLASAAILLGTDMPEMLEYAVECVNYARSKWHRAFELRKFVEQGVARFAINVFQRDKMSSSCSAKNSNTASPSVDENIDGDDDDDETRQREVVAEESGEEEEERTNVGFFTLVEEHDDGAALNNDESSTSEGTPTPPTKSPRGGPNTPGEFPTAIASPSSSSSPSLTTNNLTSFNKKKSSNQKSDNKTNNNQVQKKQFPGDDGGWLGNEFFFPKHIRDQLRNRLEVYATSLPYIKEVCFTEFESTVDLEEALVASCLLVPLAGLPFKLRRTGDWVCDGGLRSFQPRKGEPGVITISAMYFNAADIVPSVFVPAWWGLYPPSEEQYRQLFALGYNDMLVWLWKNNVLEKPKTVEERKEKLMKYDSGKMPQKHGIVGYILDFFAGVFFLGILRPFAFIAIYAELWFVSTLCFFATVFHEVFPRMFDFLIGTKSLRNKKAGGRMETVKDFWAVIRNLTSLKTMLHLAIGYRNVNSKRLGKYSRLYRLFQPFVANGKKTTEEKTEKKNE